MKALILRAPTVNGKRDWFAQPEVLGVVICSVQYLHDVILTGKGVYVRDLSPRQRGTRGVNPNTRVPPAGTLQI